MKSSPLVRRLIMHVTTFGVKFSIFVILLGLIIKSVKELDYYYNIIM